ncbi:MAG: hypothetical protein PHU12_01150 [Candidatus Aenigmarchaeota archaeon]|nr:hypothetical protein [Candidatus Aenigmarchaeota archaeon]
MKNNFIKENSTFLPILIMLLFLGYIFYAYHIEITTNLGIEKTYGLLCLSLISAVLLITTGAFLLWRWIKSNDKTTLIWSISFLLYSVTFIGLIFKSLGFSWANDKIPEIFFFFRQFMIIWVAGMIYGLYNILKDRKKTYQSWLFRILASLIIIAGYAWFYYNLILNATVADVAIHTTMLGFINFMFVPACVIISYLFLKFGKTEGIKSIRIIGFGFLILAISYMLWAPFHDDVFYFICYSVFVLSLICILIGFVLLASEKYRIFYNKNTSMTI